ncbi:hypothetical protein L596_018449 [Steinernema carpocapsae]|uniref:Uncharacterized protein n=1 Tax=Steinernema carpocapsae TaxID=34508 RepID=A0A4U5N5D6_STECR|nr:hypothetical protein L596_018449 [Steinernema carpocapsae]
MPFPFKRRSAMTENSEKGRISITNKRIEADHQILDALTEENRQLRAQLEEQKVLQMELRSALERAEQRGHSLELPTLARLGKGQTLCDKSKVIVCRVLQFARANCGQNAVEWTSSVTGIKRQTLRTYEQETDIHLSVTSVEEGTLAYKLPPC